MDVVANGSTKILAEKNNSDEFPKSVTLYFEKAFSFIESHKICLFCTRACKFMLNYA